MEIKKAQIFGNAHRELRFCNRVNFESGRTKQKSRAIGQWGQLLESSVDL
jgi:hypothetical protein